VARVKANRWVKAVAALSAALAVAIPAWAQTAGVGIRWGVTTARTRLVIDSPTRVLVTAEPGDNGRMTFALKGLTLADESRGEGRGRVKDWRLNTADDGARLTLDLEPGSAVAERFAIAPKSDGAGYRYVIDITASSARGFGEVKIERPRADADGVAVVAVARTRQAPLAALGPRQRKVIVIDAGHGGHDPGARGAEANEKDITLAAALHLRRRLLRDGRYKVVMTRTKDVFVPLEERVRIARRAGADLFIALHADSAGADDATHGASVYTLSGRGESRVKEVMGAHEWFSRAAPRNDPAVKGILIDLTQRTTLNRSNEFAQVLVDRMSEKIDVLPRTHRDAGYFVLLAPDVPAVLLEMGFITSHEDAARLTDPVKRNALMDMVARAIDDYFRPEVKLAAS